MRRLVENRRVLVAAPGYLDRSGRPEGAEARSRLTALRYGEGDEPWRLLGPDGRGAGGAAHPPARRRRRRRARLGARRARVMFESEVDVADDLAAGRLERILPGFAGAAAPIYALFPSRRQVSVRLRLFIELLVDRLRGRAPG